ncbi:MAG: TonB-dependent siderophore receptor [Terracidiphilus sp.]
MSPSLFVRASYFTRTLLALVVFAATVPHILWAQAPRPAELPAQSQSTAAQSATQSTTAQQKIAPVTTTVLVHGDINGDYLPESVTVGNLTGLPIKNAPLSATAVTRDLLNDQVARLLSDVIQNDASVEDDYVPVGYYGDYQIRGFPIDLATGLEINGLTIAGEQDVPLEDKERVEFMHGLAGVESGVASGGGLINYVTKRPAPVKALDFATDQYGSVLGATDLGRLFGSHQQVGARLNLAGESIQTYMNGTGGWRAMGAGAADFKISPRAMLKGDFEYQHKTERDGSGYQLLGGTTLPDINLIYRSTMLGEQSWAPSDTYDVFNTNARFDYHFPGQWSAFAAASLSHSLIQDNVIYAYGSSIDPNTYLPNCPDAPNAPEYFFCPDGNYGIYDYRDPGELRIDAVSEGMLIGRVKTGAIAHNIVAGGELFMRSVQQPGFYSVQNPYDPSGIVQDGAVYTYLGAENIYQPLVPYPIEDPVEKAGPRRLWQDSHQSSAILQDRIELPHRIQLMAGGRYDALRDHNYSLYASCTDFTVPGACALEPTDKPAWLPQFAATYSPIPSLTLYSNYGVLLSLGPQAPWWVDNGSEFLAPFNTRQFEVGAKYEPGTRILITGDYFHMRAPFIYPKVIAGADNTCPSGNAGDFCFESEGRETHNGVELNAEGRAARWLRLNASLAGLHAVSENTGTPSYDNRQVINVPRVHTSVFADVSVPHINGLYLMPGWSYSSSKEATRDDRVSVPAFNLFNLGLRYTPGGERGRATFRIYANNITNKKYWSDTGASYGDTFVWLGAPTLVRLSAHYTF